MTETLRGESGWRRALLPLSVVLNLFFIAFIGGHLLHIYKMEKGFGTPLGRALANAEASLSPRDAAAFGAVIRRGAPHYGQDLRQLAETRRELNHQVTAEQFDPEKTRQALAGWQTAWSRFIDDFGDTFVEALAQVSPEGRRKLTTEFPGAPPAPPPP